MENKSLPDLLALSGSGGGGALDFGLLLLRPQFGALGAGLFGFELELFRDIDLFVAVSLSLPDKMLDMLPILDNEL